MPRAQELPPYYHECSEVRAGWRRAGGEGGKINKYQPRAAPDEVTGGAGGDPVQASDWSEPLVLSCYWSIREQQSVQCLLL